MKRLQLIADDLTGALDTAAQFVTPTQSIPVFLSGRLPASLPGSFAIDGGTREMEGKAASAASRRHCAFFEIGPGVVAFKKVDSLLRGHPGLEIGALFKVMRPGHCVIAPAFPFHGRVTRGGLQFAKIEGSWIRVGEDLFATLDSRGIAVQRKRPGQPLPRGVSLWDAETDDDLRKVANAAVGLTKTVLWCGSGGLAAALADAEVPAAVMLERPILGVFGSDHPATATQLSACTGHVVAVPDNDALALSVLLSERQICLARFEFPAGTERAAASKLIEGTLSKLAFQLPPPRSLLVAGGETLRALCVALETERLDVIGQFIPGVPVSVMVGGRWDGVRVASKSGAFGDDLLLRRILSLDAQP
jgi:D-threonate/D-erythronate kinase